MRDAVEEIIDIPGKSMTEMLEEKKARYVWELSLPAREKAELRYEVKAVIPEKK